MKFTQLCFFYMLSAVLLISSASAGQLSQRNPMFPFYGKIEKTVFKQVEISKRAEKDAERDFQKEQYAPISKNENLEKTLYDKKYNDHYQKLLLTICPLSMLIKDEIQERGPIEIKAERIRELPMKIIENRFAIKNTWNNQNTISSFYYWIYPDNNLDNLFEMFAEIDEKEFPKRIILKKIRFGGIFAYIQESSSEEIRIARKEQFLKILLCDTVLQDKRGNTVLHEYRGMERIGIDVSKDVFISESLVRTENFQGKNPLHAACFNERADSAWYAFLLKNGADPHKETSHRQKTPLEFLIGECCFNNETGEDDIKIVKLFMEYGVDINARLGIEEKTVLLSATEKNSLITVKMLLQCGADPNIPGFFPNSTPLINAIRNKNFEIIELLLQFGADPNVKDCGETLFTAFVKHGSSEETLELLIKYGADINKEYENGETILDITDNPRFIEILLKHKPNFLEILNRQGQSILHRLSIQEKPAKLSMLLKNGANPNIKNSQGQTPLHLACSKGCIEIMTALFKEGNADPNVRDLEENTSLHCFVKSKSFLFSTDDKKYEELQEKIKIIKLLIEYKVNLNAQDANGDTALHKVWFLWKNDEYYGKIARSLVENGANPNIKNSQGQTPLHCACEKNIIENIKVLLEEGNADPNVHDGDRNTPFHCFVKSKSFLFSTYGAHEELQEKIKIIKLLIEYKANLNAQDANGDTVLHKVCSLWKNDDYNRKIARLLFKNGARLDITNNDGITPLDHLDDEQRVILTREIKQIAPNTIVNIYQNNNEPAPIIIQNNNSDPVNITGADSNNNQQIQNQKQNRTKLIIGSIAIGGVLGFFLLKKLGFFAWMRTLYSHS